MKKILKITLIILIMISIQFQISFVYAEAIDGPSGEIDENTLGGAYGGTGKASKSGISLDDIFSQAKSFLESGKNASTSISNSEINQASSAIFHILVAIGTILAVVIGGILGIQFMIASAEDKAKIKEAFIPYILGCIIVFGAFGIWQLVVNLLQSIAV